MKRFKAYEPDQCYLLPPSMKEWLPSDHLVYFLSDMVDSLDLSAVYASYDDGVGQPPYHPRMMVKVWLYGYCRGIRPSRKLERALHEDVGFRVLSGNQQPDHWTLSEFRRRHLDALGNLFLQTVKLAQQAGVMKLGQVAIDGTKVKAYASKHAAMSYGRLVKEEQRLRGEIARYFEESEAADREEESKHHDELPEELRTAEKRLAVIEAAKRALEEEAKQRARYEQGERRKKAKEEGRPFHPTKNPDDTSPKDNAQRNFTDPESRIMKNSDQAFIQAYNAQVAVDVDSQIIVAADLSNQAADGPHLLPLVRDVVRNCDEKPSEVLADAGYFSEANVTALEREAISVLIPPGRIRHRTWQRESAQLVPPPGKDAAAAERMRYRLDQPDGRERYRKRECSVEPVYGQIKEGRGLRQFQLRGLAKVKALWLFDCAAHNLLKLYGGRACPQPAPA